MPAKKHNFTVTEIKAGVLVVVSVALLAGFVAVISGMRVPEERQNFYVHFADTAGLNQGADVRFGGTLVGRITAITLDPNDQSRLRVDFEVRQGVPINVESEAFITQTTLMSEMHLEISTGGSGAKLLENGTEITSTAGGLFGQVGKVLEDVRALMGVDEAKKQEEEAQEAGEEDEFVTIETIFKTVDGAVAEGEGLVGDVRDVVAEKREVVSSIIDKVVEIEDKVLEIEEAANGLVGDVDGLLAENRPNIKEAIAGVRAIIDDVQPLIDQVMAVADELDDIVAMVEATLENAESLTGEASGLLADNRPVIEDLLLDLRETVRHLKTFARTMAEQPQAVIRGKSPEGRK